MSKRKVSQEGRAIPKALSCACTRHVKRTRHSEPGAAGTGESSGRTNQIEFAFTMKEKEKIKEF